MPDDIVISVENLSKRYRLGQIGATTLRESVQRLWHRLCGRDPDEVMGVVAQRSSIVPGSKLGKTVVGSRSLKVQPRQGKPDADSNDSGQPPPTLNDFQRSSTTFNDSTELWALKDVSFQVKRGEVLGIIGRNGAGKSTLLKILSRITEPTSGRAVMRGRVGSLLEVGTGFHPELTGRENVFLNGAILGMKRSEIAAKYDEIVAFSGVEQFIDTPVKRYSSGMYVRLAFAVAAHLDPEILLVDEVLAVGDVAFQKKCLGKMGEIQKEGRTVLLVSHNMSSIMNLCGRAILLDAGHLTRDADAPHVVQEYLLAGGAADGEIAWSDPVDAPGNDDVRLHSVKILQDGVDGASPVIDISKEVRVQIDYWCLRGGLPFLSSIWLRDKMGVDVFASSNANSASLTNDSWYGRPHPKGLFRAMCRIPGNFLNDGRYSVTPIIVRMPYTRVVFEEDLISFTARDNSGFQGRWIGAVRPKLAWHTEQIG